MQRWWQCEDCQAKVPLGGSGDAVRRHFESVRHIQGQRIRQLLAQPDLSYPDIARKVGVHPGTIRNFALRLNPEAHRGAGLAKRFWTCKVCERQIAVGTRGTGRSLHLKSKRHKQARRIRAMLRRPCFSYTEISRRTGLTAQTIQQMDVRMNATRPRGVERMITCTVNRHLDTWWKLNENSPVLVELNRRGFIVEPIPYCDPNGNVVGYFTHKVFVNGAVVAWHRFTPVRVGAREYLSMATPRGESNRDLDFAIYHLDGERFYIFPREFLGKLPARTVFAEAIVFKNRAMGSGPRPDFAKYRKAWSLLPRKKPQARTAEIPAKQDMPPSASLPAPSAASEADRRFNQWWEEHKNHPVLVALNQRGFIGEPVPSETAFLSYYHDRVKVNGDVIIAWRPLYETTVKEKRYLRIVRSRNAVHADFTIFHVRDELFYIFPNAYLKGRPRQTMFAYDPTPDRGNHEDRHDYNDYRDAWRLLPKSKFATKRFLAAKPEIAPPQSAEYFSPQSVAPEPDSIGELEGPPVTLSSWKCKTCDVTIRMGTGGDNAPVLRHLDSAAHQQNHMMRSLLRQPLLAHEEIALRVGVEPERVAAFAKRLGAEVNGSIIRQSAETLERRLAAWRQMHDNHPSVIRLRERGFTPEPIPQIGKRGALERYLSDRMVVNGAIVILRMLIELHIDGRCYLTLYTPRNLDFDFAIYNFKRDVFYIFPASRINEQGLGRRTCFSDNPTGLGIASHKHDFGDYREAWNLLPRKTARKKS